MLVFLWTLNLAVLASLSIDGLAAWQVINGGGGSHYGGFPSYNETASILDASLQWSRNQITRRFLVGISLGCRPMFAYWISATPTYLSDLKPLNNYVKNLTAAFYQSINSEEEELLKQCVQSDYIGQRDKDLLQKVLTDKTGRSGAHPTQNLRNHELPPWPANGKLLVTSLHHAREPTSLTVAFHAHIQLLNAIDQYQNTPNPLSTNIYALMADREWLWLPFVNPDAYIDIDYGADIMLRKNRRKTCTPPLKPTQTETLDQKGIWNRMTERLFPRAVQRYLVYEKSPLTSHDGVDINRNYDNHFVSEHDPCDAEEYEGKEAFSESETRAVRRLAKVFSPQMALNFHAYGDFWTHPFNCCTEKRLSKEQQEVFDELRDVLNVTHFGSAPTLSVLGYEATGEADDYLMEALGIYSMSPEVGPEISGFYPPPKLVRSINEANFERILQVLEKAGPQLVVKIEGASSSSSNVVKVVVRNSGLAPLSTGALVFNLIDVAKGDVDGKVASSEKLPQDPLRNGPLADTVAFVGNGPLAETGAQTDESERQFGNDKSESVKFTISSFPVDVGKLFRATFGKMFGRREIFEVRNVPKTYRINDGEGKVVGKRSGSRFEVEIDGGMEARSQISVALCDFPEAVEGEKWVVDICYVKKRDSGRICGVVETGISAKLSATVI